MGSIGRAVAVIPAVRVGELIAGGVFRCPCRPIARTGGQVATPRTLTVSMLHTGCENRMILT